MATERAGGKPVNWPSLHETANPVIVHIEICGEVLPFTAKALWNRWRRGQWIPDDWAAYFSELAETA